MRTALALVLTVLAAPALAGAIPIFGVYGNAAGCAFYAQGRATDGMELLTADTFVSGATGCDFAALARTAADTLAISAVCTGIGDAGPDAVEVSGAADGYTVSITGVGKWGPLPACEHIVMPGEVRT